MHISKNTRRNVIAVITLVSIALSFSGCARARNMGKVAVIDYQVVLANHPDRKDAEKKLDDAYREVQKQLEKQKDASISQDEKMQKMQQFQRQMIAQEKTLIAPIKADVNEKIDETMKEKGYTAVFSKDSLVRGGDDITDEILKEEGLSDEEIKKAKAAVEDPLN